MKKIAALMLFFCFAVQSFSQGETSNFKTNPNSIYFELLGNGLLYSINYDRVLKTTDKLTFSGRLGFSYVNIGFFDTIKGVIVPVEFLAWTGQRKGHFEFGFGFSTQRIETEDISILGPTQYTQSTASYLTGRIGYRLQKPEGGFMLRAGFVPMWLLAESVSRGEVDRTSFIPYFGLSLGHSF